MANRELYFWLLSVGCQFGALPMVDQRQLLPQLLPSNPVARAGMVLRGAEELQCFLDQPVNGVNAKDFRESVNLDLAGNNRPIKESAAILAMLVESSAVSTLLTNRVHVVAAKQGLAEVYPFGEGLLEGLNGVSLTGWGEGLHEALNKVVRFSPNAAAPNAELIDNELAPLDYAVYSIMRKRVPTLSNSELKFDQVQSRAKLLEREHTNSYKMRFWAKDLNLWRSLRRAQAVEQAYLLLWLESALLSLSQTN
jgi:hypothetical protein